MAINASDIFTAPSGISGYSGYSGTSGSSGYSAYSGYSGSSGTSGYSGESGTSGFSGAFSGISGYSGYSGASGYSGSSGYSGAGTSGYSGYSGAGTSGYSGYSSTGTSGYSGYSGVGTGTLTPDLNLIDNGSFLINQRYGTTSTSGIADDTYFSDRWIILTQSNTVTCVNTASASYRGGSYVLLTQDNASAQRAGILQILPWELMNCYSDGPFGGEAIALVLSARLYQNSTGAKDIRMSVLSSASGPPSDIVNDWTSGTFTTGNFFINTFGMTLIKSQSFSIDDVTITKCTMTMSAAEVAASGTDAYFFVFIHPVDTIAQNDTFGIGDVDLFAGSAARDYQQKNPGSDMNECQRYLMAYGGDASNSRLGIANYYSDTSALVQFDFSTEMRALPTVTYSSAGDFTLIYGGLSTNTCSAIAIGEPTTQFAIITMTGTGSPFTAATSGFVRAASTSTRLYFSSEL